MRLAYLHRQATGEPIQSWIRRLIRENWDYRDPLPEDLLKRPLRQTPIGRETELDTDEEPTGTTGSIGLIFKQAARPLRPSQLVREP
jgi:hypothetical protein